ncbi:MAG TPA: SMC-Scp complex subunit ScpB [Candidatus Omnitrophota bacterium]|nr:SMC-Scp complex subunit ScpB [Candidatus Omnitrophota bacterium]HPS37178.1 SMC-Scp complex subunit ScpB [Candidatus Omnitrophota bacterium]
MKTTAAQEREKQAKLKALRKELDREIQEQLEEASAAEGLVDSQKFQTESLREEDLQDPAKAKLVVEALIFASGKTLTAAEIRKVTKVLTVSQIEKIAAEIKEDYKQTNRCFELLEIAGGYEISTKKEFAPWIMRIELQRKARQATQSALETLAILAYKQPLTRAEIEALRGVDTSGVLNTLMEKNFIRIVGKKEVPGRPFMYGTTEKFLEHFGLKALQDLPSIDEIRQIVDSSVKKEQLLGTTKMVDVPQDSVPANGASQDNVEPASGDPAGNSTPELNDAKNEGEQVTSHE